MSLSPYPQYKSSSVEWLGKVPDHWKVTRLKHIAIYWVSNVDKVAADNELPVRLCNYTDVYYHDYIRPDMGLMETTATAQEIDRFGLQIDDVVITKDSEDWCDIGVPSLVVESTSDLVCGYHLAIIRPQKQAVVGKFLLRTLQSDAVNQQFQVTATGVTRYGLPKSAIGEAWLPLPSQQEQRAIADFLDRETEKIDMLVEKKRTLIERLKEERTTLITHTVTRGLPPEVARAAGLDPYPKLRSSGIEWLEEVPEHWEMKRGRFCANVNPQPLRSLHPDSEASFVPMEAVGEYGGLNLDQTRYVFEVGSGYTEFKDGDVVVAKITPCFENGKGALATGLLNGIGFGTTELHVLRPFANLDVRFLFYFSISQAFRSMGEGEMYGAGGQKRVPPAFCKNIQIPLPPVEEQHAIVDFLESQTERIDTLVTKIETAIERLQEYRSALITAAVTGKIDVREEAAL